MSHPLGTKALSKRWVWEGGEGAGEKEGMSCSGGGVGEWGGVFAVNTPGEGSEVPARMYPSCSVVRGFWKAQP